MERDGKVGVINIKKQGKGFSLKSKHDDFEQILVIIFLGQADQGENWGEGTVGDCQ